MMTHRFLKDGRGLPDELEAARVEIEALAKSYGLEFVATQFVMCTWEEINMIASYGGFPSRYPHWRHGMEYLQQQKSYEYGLSKIYEMVINTDPSYAYLLDNNLVVDQKLVMAHVFGHVDFFTNNLWFQHTDRKMLDTMANHGTRVRRFMDHYGVDEVEAWIDLCLSIDNLIDPHLLHIQRSRPPSSEEEIEAKERDGSVGKIDAKVYMDKHINPPEYLAEQRRKKQEEIDRLRTFPEEPTRDVLGFLMDNAPMKRWQRDVMRIIRDEAYYFAPQGQTKIMNEGWATYWHTKMMTEHILSDSEVITYADHHSGVVAMQPGQLNPYKLGVELWHDIERRWDRGRFGKEFWDSPPSVRRKWDTGAGLGREKIFEVRRTHNDVTFLDTFLTEDFCREQGFFTTKYDPKSREWLIDSHEFKAVKKQLLDMLAMRGTPRISVVDANEGGTGALRLVHAHEGLDIQLDWAGVTMKNLAGIWQRSVILDTVIDDKPIRLTHDGTELRKTKMKEKSA